MDDRTKMLIYGFNREAQTNLFPKDVPYYNIPQIVNHICVLFYWQRECFKLHGTYNIKLSEDNMKATVLKSEPNWNTVYGNFVFNQNLCPNTVIEYELDTNQYRAIGIVTVGKEKENYDKLVWNYSDYLHEAVYAWHNGSLYGRGCGSKDRRHMIPPKDGGKLRMTVDIPDKSLIFHHVSGNKFAGKYTNIDYSMTYRLAVSMSGKQTVQLFKFEMKRSLQ